jgi:UDPglucose 6-dehydrogenase
MYVRFKLHSVRATQVNNSQHHIAVIGTGYVGLTTGTCLAQLGHFVICVDNNLEKLASLDAGIMPIYEEGLSELVSRQRESGRLSFTSDILSAVSSAEFVFLCLPTPQGEDGFADLSAIKAVVKQISGHLMPETIVVNKSTVPVNSALLVRNMLNNPQIHVVSNPEFLREGSAISDFLNPDRIVIGSENQIAGERVAGLYLGIRSPVVVTDPVSAESIKYMANAFLALKISFVNQAASFCDAVGADVLEVMRGLSFDPRIGGTFLTPGPGWGGSCFPKDTEALVAMAKSVDRPMSLVEEAIVANQNHIDAVAKLIRSEAKATGVSNPRIALLGLSFKAETDDTRCSPAVDIIKSLQSEFENLIVFDPLAITPKELEITRAKTQEEAMKGADVTAILTEWSAFKNLEPSSVRSLMRGNVIIDTRYLLESEQFSRHNLHVVQIGRK